MPKDKATLEAELLQSGIVVGEDFSFAPEKLQTPLNVALGISPLFLLGTRWLANVSIGKPRIIDVSIITQLGNVLNVRLAMDRTRKSNSSGNHICRKQALEGRY